MADADSVTLGKINYWCREKHYRHMQNVAVEGMKKYGNDPFLKFFNAFSMILEDRVQEGMRDLQMLKDRQDVNLCSLLCLIYAHKKARIVDREAVQELETTLRTARKSAGEKGLYFAGLFLSHTGKHDKAKEYVTRSIQMNGKYKEALALRGWLELLGETKDVKKALKFFDESLQQEGIKDIDAMFGKAKFFEMRRNYNGALEMCNTLIVTIQNFVPGLIEKMKITLALQDWDQVVETAQRALNTDSGCPQAHRFMILFMLCREGNYQDASQMIGDLLQALDRVEPKNPVLYHEFAKVFCRVCGRSPEVLQQTYYLQERAVSLDPNNAEYVIELGYEELLRRKTKEAHKCFQNAMKLNESSVEALTGVIRCQIIEGMLDDAEQQLEFLHEVQQGAGLSAELTFARAELAFKKQQAPEKIIELLGEATNTHFANIKGVPLGMEYFYKIDPDFVVLIAKAYLEFAPQQPPNPGQPSSEILAKCSQLLDPIARVVPGLMEVLYLMAKIKYLTGDIDSAQGTLQHCLTQDTSYSDAHILMAQIYLYQSNFKMANQSLETGLSYNFQVREHPLYHLIKARILKKQNEIDEAIRTLQMAMSLPGVTTQNHSSDVKKGIQISTNDRVSVFLELVDAYLAQDSQHEAAKVMQDALNEFAGTPEEIRITIANADLAVGRGDVEGALTQLRSISPEQPYFVQAREKMAQIYLHHRKDRRLYAGCYRELFDRCPNQHTSLLLGDAYMAIQEPDRAIEVYEAALKKNPRDYSLASKIGQAYVKTHHYGKAINYYEAAIKSGGKAVLRYDLASLLSKMRQFDKTEKILKQAIDLDGSSTELETMIDVTKYYMVYAEVYTKKDKVNESMLYLTKAKDHQQRVLKRVSVEQPDLHSAQKQTAASICIKMAQHCINARDYDKAVKLYKEALVHSENDVKVQLKLANLYLMKEDLDFCEQQCMQLLKEQEENDDATIMMADLMFRKNDYENAMYHFQQLLERKPDHYEAMARLVDLMRRAGKLDEVPRFFELAEKKSNRTTLDSGFNYCKGLYEWYGGNTSAAIGYFNKARKDSQFGMKATYNMIEICLNPDSETLGGEVFENMEEDMGMSVQDSGVSGHIRTAETLLREIKPRAQNYRTQLLENMLIVTTKDKMAIEKALQNFVDLAADREDSGCLYGMAAAYMVLKQSPRARNQLKRVAKNSWNMEDAEYLEKSWLLLADIYIQGAKYDMAIELLNKCLHHNKSCCKAYEYLGFIMEKEQSHKDAAKNYEMAWKYGNKSNPNIGFKLAFNYLKARRYIDAIEICHAVLALQPQYPKIRKEVLDKARGSIRV